MKKLAILGCSLFLFSLFNFNKANNDLIVSTIDENSYGAITIRKAQSNNNVQVGRTYVQNGQNDNHRVIRFATPVSGDFFDIKYHVSVEGYNNITKDVNVVYKGIETNNEISYYNGTDIVQEKTELTNDWYWACFTIEFSTYKYADANISSYITVNNTIDSVAKENVTLKNQISSYVASIDPSLIGKWKDSNNLVVINENSLIINDYKLNYVDYLNDYYVFYNGVNFIKVKLDNSSLIVKGKLDVDNINLTLEKNMLIDCPVTFEEKSELTIGDEEIKFTIPEGVSYTAHYEKNEKFYSNYGSLPTEAGYYALIVDTVENDTYNATHVWKTFKLNEKPSVEKENLVISFDFDAGTSFALGIAPTFKVLNSEGTSVDDANISITYSSDTTRYNSSELPTVAGDYGITITVNESEKYNTISKNTWFRIENRIITTISSSFNNIYEGTIEDLNKIIDGDKKSYCWFAGEFATDNYIQIDYSYKKELNRLAFTFDTNDYFKFKVQYLNGDQYEDITTEQDGSNGVAAFNSTIETTSIRIVSTGGRGCWAKVYEMNLYFSPTVINNGFTLVNSLNYLSDNNLSTYTFFDWHYTSDNNIILDYGKTIDVNTITLLTECDDHSLDVAGEMKFAYSVDGITYTDIEGTYEGINILVKLSEAISARYIKVTPVITEASPNGLTIREFGVNLNKFDVSAEFSDETAFTYDGNAHSPEVTIPYGVNYSVHYNSDDLKLYNQTEAKDIAYWAMVIDFEASEIYNFVGQTYIVFHIDAAK